MGNCCCHWTIIYKSLPHLHIFIAFIEFLCGIIRIVLFFSPVTPTGSSQQSINGQAPLSQSQNYTSQYVVAFAIDWISSIVPTLTGLFVTLMTIIVILRVLVSCSNKNSRGQTSSSEEINTTGWFRRFWNNKALRRIIALDCNCPCYKARPKLRFQVRMCFCAVILILRIIAIALYATSAIDVNRAQGLADLAGFTLVFLFLTFLLDLYHYCVWWHYTPYLDTTCCCCRAWRHQRYLPYILVGDYRDERIWGDKLCPHNPCPNRELEHIGTFHSDKYQPQARWTDIPKPEPSSDSKKKPKHQPTYVGFHTTKPEFAVKIAQGGFLPSSKGMIGPGVYFARSLEATIGKVGGAGGFGAWIIAEVDMGKVFVVHRRSREQEIARTGEWYAEYDTCYCIHPDDSLDEFCIKDPSRQIIRWVTIIEEKDDPKVKQLGLDTEFESTKCGCF